MQIGLENISRGCTPVPPGIQRMAPIFERQAADGYECRMFWEALQLSGCINVPTLGVSILMFLPIKLSVTAFYPL